MKRAVLCCTLVIVAISFRFEIEMIREEWEKKRERDEQN